MQSSKQSFATQLFAGRPYEVVNGMGMRKLPNGNVVKVTIETSGHSGHYDKLVVKVINPKDAVVDQTNYIFNAYLLKNPMKRQDYHTFEVIEHCGWEWYILEPSLQSIDYMFGCIEAYVNYFK